MDFVPRTPALSEANPISIAQLSPAVEDQKQRYFRGTVVLLWPYSSSTKQFRVLLSEPDFRLRGSQGQVRITFQGLNAEAVAKSQVGIGDTVLLGLDGVKWEKKGDEEQAFAGELDWSLIYRNRVVLEIYRGAKPFDTIDINSIPQEEDEKEEREDGISRSTPVVATSTKSPPAPSQSLQAPSVSQTTLSPFRLDDSSIFGYTEEEDGYIFGKGRKRTKFGRPSSEWVFVDSPPSPVKDTSNWSTNEFEFESGEDEDIPDQASVHVTSPTPTAQPIEDGTKADNYECFESSSSPEDDGSDLHLRPHLGQHEEPVTSGAVDGRAAEAAPDHRIVGDSEEAVAGNLSQVEAIEDSMRIPTPELESHAILLPTASPVQHGSEEAPPKEIVEHDAQETIESGISYFGTQVGLGGEDNSPNHVEETQAVKTSLQPLVAAEDVVVDRPPISVVDVEAPTQSNVISDLRQQSLDSEVSSAEPEGDTQGLDFYAGVPTQEYGIDDELREGWGGGSANETLSATFDPEDGTGEHVEEGVEEYMPGMGERPESPSDLEEDEDDSVFSIVGDDTQRPTAVTAPVQPEVIVIDSDDESQVSSAGPGDVSDNLAHPHGIPSPTHRTTDIPDEGLDHGEARHESPGADATFDDRMVDISSQDGRDEDHDQQGAPEAARHLGLDGCVEYEPSPDYLPLFSTISRDQTTERQVRRSPPPPLVLADAGSSTEIESGQQRLRSWSIPVRTISHQAQKSRWRSTLHAGSQQMTPGNTQETIHSKSREASPPSPTSHNLLTPRLSQKSQSVTSTIDTSDMEVTFEDDKTESPVDKDLTPVGSFVSRPTSEQKAEPLSTGALNEQTEIYPNGVRSESLESRKSSADAVEPPLQALVGPRLEEEMTPVESKHVSSQLSWAVGELRTRLAYFCPLSLLPENLNSTVDTLSIVASATPVLRGTRKPRDYFTTMHLLDPSTAGTAVCAQLFRKQKDALPVAAKGDVILLRNFKVRRVDDKVTLCTVGHSSWAVFVQGDEKNVQIKGPSVKYREGERTCVKELRQWYNEEGEELIEKGESLQPNNKYTRASGAMDDSAVSSRENEKNMVRKYRRARNSTGRRLTVHHLRHGRQYTDSPPSKNIHKLRDGTLYAHL